MTKEQAEEAAQFMETLAKPYLDVGMTMAAAPYVRAILALRTFTPLVERLEKIEELTEHDPKTTRPEAFASLNRISAHAETGLALARKEP